MIKRRSVLKLMAAPALMTVARPGFAQAKEKVTYAYLLDPAYDAVTWAMSNGKVDLRSDHGRGARACDPATDPGHLGQAVRRDHDGGDRRAAGGGARPRAAGAVDGAAAVAGRRGRPASGSRATRRSRIRRSSRASRSAPMRCARPATPRCGSRSSTSTASTPRSKAATSSRSRSRRPTCPARWPPARSTPRR